MNITSVVMADHCYGCSACYNSCPHKCISMMKNGEGFLLPSVESELCSQCGICLDVCIANQPLKKRNILAGYAAVGKSDELFWRSSSGAVFAHIARYVISNQNGYVCGATMTDEMSVKHILIDSMDDLWRLQGSKYIQSDLNDVFSRIDALLSHRKKVLFAGTPCQVAGLYKYLRHDREGLFTIDLICRGVPSSDLFKKNIEALEKRFHKKIVRISFRGKSKYEMTSYSLRLTFADGSEKCIPGTEDVYYNMFINGMTYRESCYMCSYAASDRIGDITLGDCNNIRAYTELLPLCKAVSTVLVNSNKGTQLWNSIQADMNWVSADISTEIRRNIPLHAPVPRPAARDTVYNVLLHTASFLSDGRQYMVCDSFQDKVKRWIIHRIPTAKRQKFRKCIKSIKGKK